MACTKPSRSFSWLTRTVATPCRPHPNVTIFSMTNAAPVSPATLCWLPMANPEYDELFFGT
jgi:hypothetical protein